MDAPERSGVNDGTAVPWSQQVADTSSALAFVAAGMVATQEAIDALQEAVESMLGLVSPDPPPMSCGGIKMYDHRDCWECKKPVPVQTCPFCGGERSCMYCYGCPDCP